MVAGRRGGPVSSRVSTFPNVFYGRICTKFGTAVGAAEVITCAKVFGDRLRGVDSVGIEYCHLPLTRSVAVDTGLALPRSP